MAPALFSRQTRMRGALSVVLIGVCACQADRLTTSDPVVALAGEAWSGDTLVLRSTAFTGRDSVPIVTVGADTLATWSGGPDTAYVLLPDTGGVIQVAVRLHGGGVALAGVTVHGLRSAAPGPLTWDDTPYPFPSPGPGDPTALASHEGRLVLVDYRSNTYRPLTPDTDIWLPKCYPTLSLPIPSASSPGLITVAHGCGPLVAVPINASSPAPDTGPPLAGWTAVHLSPGNWLVAYKNQGLQLLHGSPAAGFTTLQNLGNGSAQSYAISPRGDRVVPRQSGQGLVAIDPAAPGVAFTVPGVELTGGAAFTETGDTLLAVVYDSGGAALLELDAGTGARLREVPVSAWELEVVVDPGRPWLYLTGVEGNGVYGDVVHGQVVVYVYDRASLTRLATLRVPISAIPPNSSAPLAGLYVPILDPVRRELYLTMNFFVNPQYVFRFDLMP